MDRAELADLFSASSCSSLRTAPPPGLLPKLLMLEVCSLDNRRRRSVSVSITGDRSSLGSCGRQSCSPLPDQTTSPVPGALLPMRLLSSREVRSEVSFRMRYIRKKNEGNGSSNCSESTFVPTANCRKMGDPRPHTSRDDSQRDRGSFAVRERQDKGGNVTGTHLRYILEECKGHNYCKGILSFTTYYIWSMCARLLHIP